MRLAASKVLGPLLLLLAGLAPAALADGMIIVQPPPDWEPRRPLPWRGGIFPLAVEHHDVKVTIDGQVATTVVDQTFRNPLPQRLEGTYMFPVPDDAALDKFSMWIEGVEMQGEVLDKDRALSIYEGIVRRMQDPALLEYAGRGAFKVRIFPIEPNGTKRVKLTYRQVLKADAGRCRYRYPLNTEKFSSEPLRRASIVVELKSESPIKGVYSPWHDVDVRRRGEREVLASWEATNTKPSRDFVLDYDVSPSDVGLSLRTHGLRGEDGTFLMMVAPKVELSQGERTPKDVVFVVDTSGSMTQDDRMEQARKALAHGVARLNPEDRFAIVDFATDARTWRDELTTADADAKASAQAYVKNLLARGGTAIDDALRRALAFRKAPDPARPLTVVFMTDGQPTIGEVEPERILANLKQAPAADARIFVWGVGSDLNTVLLDTIAETWRGDRHYVLPGEDIEVAMSGFFDAIAAPALTDVELKFEGQVRVHDVYPRRLPDLFAGKQLIVVGRFSGEGPGAVRLRGRVQGQPREYVWEGTFRRGEEHPHIPVLWAKRKIGFLLDEIRLRGESAEVKEEVVRLARRYGLPTPYTSYLVLEEGARRGQPVPTTGRPGDDAAQEAFSRLRERGGAGGGMAPPAAPSPGRVDGEGAVRASRAAAEMRDAAKASAANEAGVDEAVLEESIRQVAGRTFYKRGDTWVESTIGARTDGWKQVEAFSDAYFALVKEQPALAPFLALGKVIFKAGDVVFEVK